MATYDMRRRLFAEVLGTAFLLAGVVGSGIMGDTLAAGNDAVALLANSVATGAILVVLILIFGPISGGHFNPAVTLAIALRGLLPRREVGPYVAAQVAGAMIGVIIANAMFGEPLIAAATTTRTGGALWLGEVVATVGLLATIFGCLRTRPDAVPYAVGLFITAGYWFTSSTSFANPAVTLARAFTDTFTGIRPMDVPAFIVAQLVGTVVLTLAFRWLLRPGFEPVPG